MLASKAKHIKSTPPLSIFTFISEVIEVSSITKLNN